MATNSTHRRVPADREDDGLIGLPADESAEWRLPTLSALQVAEEGFNDVRLFLQSARAAMTGGAYSQTLIDPHRLAKREVRRRRFRESVLGGDLFSDPAWDILLVLYSEFPLRKHLLIRDFVVSIGIPLTTILRWLAALEGRGLIWRRDDERDRRAVNVGLTELGTQLMTRCFAD